MAEAKVKLELVDVLGGPLTDPHLSVEFFSSENARHFNVTLAPQGNSSFTITLPDPGDGIYRVMLVPTNYQTIQFFLRVAEGQTATRAPVVFPVHPGKVVDIAAPAFGALPAPLRKFLTQASLGAFPQRGGTLYAALPPLLKAALLNLYTKSAATVLGDGDTVFAKLGGMIDLHQDRLFAKVTSGLLEEAMQHPFFHPVSDSLHTPLAPYHLIQKSFKTRDAQGNLQLTFLRKGETGNDYLVDMDIDESQGIGHLFEVVGNGVTGNLTNPYSVREILIRSQKLEPLYGFRFAASGAATVASAATG